jgi:chemotaxis protein methyltransferase CheR
MAIETLALDLTRTQFDTIRSFLHQTCGIKLNEGKESLVKSRLMKRVRMLGLADFDAYLKYLENDSASNERGALVDALTTNKTSFFREYEHFSFLRDQVLPRLLAEKRSLRIWSAGCSTGEEPYSIAMLLRESIPDLDRRDVRILATDISSRVLKLAQEGMYGQEEVKDIPGNMLQKYFSVVSCKGNPSYQVQDSLRKLLRFAPLNLMGKWPMKGPFDVIFCRNVMIYFEKPTQQWLVQRFYHLLASGGHLFVGHSESLTASAHQLHYVQPATYQK